MSMYQPVHVVIKRIVAAESDQRAESQTIGKEDLSGSIQPHLVQEAESTFKYWAIVS